MLQNSVALGICTLYQHHGPCTDDQEKDSRLESSNVTYTSTLACGRPGRLAGVDDLIRLELSLTCYVLAQSLKGA